MVNTVVYWLDFWFYDKDCKQVFKHVAEGPFVAPPWNRLEELRREAEADGLACSVQITPEAKTLA